MIKSYGLAGHSQETRTELNLGAPYILMKNARPEPHFVASESGFWVEPLSLRTLQELAAAATAQVNEEYTRRMGAIADAYPLHERESWPVQLQEARELQSDPDAATPWIDQCAAQRGLTREELASRIVAKDLAYRQVSGFLSGVRQKHEDEIDALLEAGEASREALSNYHWAEYWEPEIAPLTGDDSEVPHD